jgi:zinc-binding alcohol dehydrogenase family protein
VSSYRIGDEVFFAGDITRAGCNAELVAVDERIAGRKPEKLSYEQAAAMPLTTLTAWEGLLEAMRVDEGRGETVLIVGGGGGVGSIAIQIAKEVCGLRVIATASQPESETFCRQLGAEQVINHRQQLPTQLKRGILGDKVRYIFSTAELTNFPQLIECLAPLGHICVILAGDPARQLDVSGLFTLRGSLSFEFMFSRPRYEVEPQKQGEILNEVSRLLDEGTLRSTMTESMSWRDIQDAHGRIETMHTIGKLVLTID